MRHKIIVSYTNPMSGYQILPDIPERNHKNVVEDTLAVNAREYTLSEFRRRFPAKLRQKMISNFLDPHFRSYEDLSLRDLEIKLVNRLTQ